MTAKEMFNNKFNEIKGDSDLSKKFTSTSLASNNRAYPVLNTNIKTLNTYSSYVYSIYSNPDEDHHEKYEVLRRFRAFNEGGRYEPSEEEKAHREQRINILISAYETFTNRHSMSRFLITWILSLNSDYKTYEHTDYLFDTMPSSILNNYDSYVKEMCINVNSDITNPAFAIVTLISNPELLDYYLDYYTSNDPNFDNDISALLSDSMILKRVKACQASALKVEALLFSLYEHMIGFNSSSSNYDTKIKEFLSAIKGKLSSLDYTNWSSKLFVFEDNFFDGLYAFLTNLTDAEKQEIILSIDTLTSGDYESSDSDEDYTDEEYDTGEGEDVPSKSKRRRGQNKFTRNLLKRVGKNNERCEIIGCPVCGKNYLRSSHILRWKDSDKKQKTNPYNGLLLCPNHDFLFDHLLISFDNNGNILLRDDIEASVYASLGVDENTKINYNQKFEEFMAKHRKAFENRGWDKK